MKNCVSGGKQMDSHMRISIKQPSQDRIRKLLAKKAKRKNYVKN